MSENERREGAPGTAGNGQDAAAREPAPACALPDTEGICPICGAAYAWEKAHQICPRCRIPQSCCN